MELVINPPQSVFDQLIKLAAETNGWGHHAKDYKFYKEGFDKFWLICMVDKTKDESNNFVASGSLARWDDKNGEPLYSIGLFYCKEEYRGQGYAKQVFKSMMDIVGGANCVLMAASDMSEKYANGFGFKKMPAYWHFKANTVPGKLRVPELSNEYSTKNWKDVDMDQLDAYDSTICPLNRKQRNPLLFQLEEVYTRVAFNSNQKIVGYCSIRIVNLNRLLVDPFYAENEEVAARLLADVAKEIPNFGNFEKLIFRCPEINEGMKSLLARFFPSEAYETKVRTRVQFTKKLIEARDEVVYSAGCPTHQFV